MTFSMRTLSPALSASPRLSIDLGERREKCNKHQSLSHRCVSVLVFRFLSVWTEEYTWHHVWYPLTNWIANTKCLHVLWCAQGIDRISSHAFQTQFGHLSANFVEHLDCASGSVVYTTISKSNTLPPRLCGQMEGS